jgi:hypothetical protein
MELLPGISGREVGEALRLLLDVVLESPSANTKARLSGRLRTWWEARPADRDGAGQV